MIYFGTTATMRSIIHLIKLFLLKLNFIIHFFLFTCLLLRYVCVCVLCGWVALVLYCWRSTFETDTSSERPHFSFYGSWLIKSSWIITVFSRFVVPFRRVSVSQLVDSNEQKRENIPPNYNAALNIAKTQADSRHCR